MPPIGQFPVIFSRIPFETVTRLGFCRTIHKDCLSPTAPRHDNSEKSRINGLWLYGEI